jgi:ligand-binding sensor domain-containing protein
MLKKVLVFALFLGFVSQLSLAGELKIESVDHPMLKGKRVVSVSSKGGLTAWATHNQIVSIDSDKKANTFDSNNSLLVEAATISDVAICEGEIWATQINPTNGYGIYRFDGKNWHVYKDPEKEGILNNRIMKIHVDGDDIIWFGNEHQGVTRMVEAIPIKFKNQKIIHLFDNRLLSLHMLQTHLWIGTSNGIVRYRSEIKSNYYLNIDLWKYPEFPARAAYSLATYGHNSIVAGTDTGLAIFNGKDWRMFKKKAGVQALPAMCLLRDGNDIWIGSPTGLQRWNPSNPSKIYTTADGLPSNSVNKLDFDSEGNILVATDGGAAIIKKQ